MNDIHPRLIRCFSTVFPGLAESRIPAASPETVADWDSVSALTLLSVIEEEFSCQIDLDALPELTSFQAIAAYLATLS